MRKLLIFAALVAQAADASAIDRYRATAMSCAAIRSTIRRDGAVILQFSPASPGAPILYDRYASGDAGCGAGYYPSATSVPTRDDPSCEVQICRTRWGRNNR